MRISDWSSDVCSSDLIGVADQLLLPVVAQAAVLFLGDAAQRRAERQDREQLVDLLLVLGEDVGDRGLLQDGRDLVGPRIRMERPRSGAQTGGRAGPGDRTRTRLNYNH